jgi:hypothetical protein
MTKITKLLSRRDRPTEQVMSRLDSVTSTYGRVMDADPTETLDRLQRLRYGTKGRKQGEPALSLGR